MLFRKGFLQGIGEGRITLAFRRWRRPSVTSGGTLLTPVGELTIGAVRLVEVGSISESEAKAAGYASRQALVEELARRRDGEVYRIELGSLRPDPRIALRESGAPTSDEMEDILRRLSRLDRRAASGPWTGATLAVLADNPGVRAGDLCSKAGMEKESFKRNVRKLKNLGLTESLGTGYRLSPRGKAVLARVSGLDPSSEVL